MRLLKPPKSSHIQIVGVCVSEHKKEEKRTKNFPRFVSGNAAKCGGQLEPHGHRSRECVVRVVATAKQCRRHSRRRRRSGGHRRRKCSGATGWCRRFRSRFRRWADRRSAGISLPHAGRYRPLHTHLLTTKLTSLLLFYACSSSLAQNTDPPERSALFFSFSLFLYCPSCKQNKTLILRLLKKALL